MAISTRQPAAELGEAYASGAAVMIVALVVIAAALAFEHIGGYIPCPLCLQQRYAYYAGIPLTFAGLVMLATGRGGIAAAIFLLVSLAFLANAGLGVYQAGAEWKYWPGPETCGTVQPLTTGGTGGILDKLSATKVIRCDEAQWTFAGLSFAGWNAVVSLLLAVLALQTAFKSRTA
jgi:disulfide bond formation protein DsbB